MSSNKTGKIATFQAYPSSISGLGIGDRLTHFHHLQEDMTLYPEDDPITTQDTPEDLSLSKMETHHRSLKRKAFMEEQTYCPGEIKKKAKRVDNIAETLLHPDGTVNSLTSPGIDVGAHPITPPLSITTEPSLGDRDLNMNKNRRKQNAPQKESEVTLNDCESTSECDEEVITSYPPTPISGQLPSPEPQSDLRQKNSSIESRKRDHHHQIHTVETLEEKRRQEERELQVYKKFVAPAIEMCCRSLKDPIIATVGEAVLKAMREILPEHLKEMRALLQPPQPPQHTPRVQPLPRSTTPSSREMGLPPSMLTDLSRPTHSSLPAPPTLGQLPFSHLNMSTSSASHFHNNYLMAAMMLQNNNPLQPHGHHHPYEDYAREHCSSMLDGHRDLSPVGMLAKQKKKTKVTDTRVSSPKSNLGPTIKTYEHPDRKFIDNCNPTHHQALFPSYESPRNERLSDYEENDFNPSGANTPDDLSQYTSSGFKRTETLNSLHLRKAKLMFFYVRSPSANLLKNYYLDVRFTKNNTSQLVKWFSNFREYFYNTIEKYTKATIATYWCEKDKDGPPPQGDTKGAVRHKIYFPYESPKNEQKLAELIKHNIATGAQDIQIDPKDLEPRNEDEAKIQIPNPSVYHDRFFHEFLICIYSDEGLWRDLLKHYKKDSDHVVPLGFYLAVRQVIKEFLKAMLINKHVEPSWKKPIYKVINLLEMDIPLEFRSIEWMNALESAKGEEDELNPE